MTTPAGAYQPPMQTMGMRPSNNLTTLKPEYRYSWEVSCRERGCAFALSVEADIFAVREAVQEHVSNGHKVNLYTVTKRLHEVWMPVPGTTANAPSH